jgi:hypothetical protein
MKKSNGNFVNTACGRAQRAGELPNGISLISFPANLLQPLRRCQLLTITRFKVLRLARVPARWILFGLDSERI